MNKKPEHYTKKEDKINEINFVTTSTELQLCY
jgi:hypothetical protein